VFLTPRIIQFDSAKVVLKRGNAKPDKLRTPLGTTRDRYRSASVPICVVKLEERQDINKTQGQNKAHQANRTAVDTCFSPSLALSDPFSPFLTFSHGSASPPIASWHFLQSSSWLNPRLWFNFKLVQQALPIALH